MFIQYSHAGDGKESPEFVKGELLIKFKSDISTQSIQRCANENGLEITREYSRIKVSLCNVSGERDVLDACKDLNEDPLVEYVEPNYIVHANILPTDPLFGNLWGMHNTGQTGGTPDADIDAPEAWDIETGNGQVVVGVIDTGVNYLHQDLDANIWINPGEIPNNGLDDDGNGFVDDVNGWDFVNNDNNPMDDHSHGSHVSGTIGAEGNNGIGVVGVNWAVSIMALKFLDSSGSGSTSDAIDAVLYAGANGAHITNNSWGGAGFSQALKDAIEFYPVLFAAAAGNDNQNTDVSAHYPSSYTSANIIAVASTDHNDNRSSFSNYGLTSVDLGAPGSNIQSTVLGQSYGYKSGTSMATPHVAGVAALLLAQDPSLSVQELKSKIMNSTDPIPALNGITVTGGRLNAHSALTGGSSGGLAGQWTHYVDWVQLPIHASWSTNWTAVIPGSYYTDGVRWAYEFSPTVVIYGFTDSSAMYIGLNYSGSPDNAIGGWMQNPDVPNWGSFHSVRGLPQGSESAGAATGAGE